MIEAWRWWHDYLVTNNRTLSSSIVAVGLYLAGCVVAPSAETGDAGTGTETAGEPELCEPYETGAPGTLTLTYQNPGDEPVYLDVRGCGGEYLPSWIQDHTIELSLACDCTCSALIDGEHEPTSCDCSEGGACGEITLLRIEPGASVTLAREVWDHQMQSIPAACVDGSESPLSCQAAATLADGDYTLVTRIWAPPPDCEDPTVCACAEGQGSCELMFFDLGSPQSYLETPLAWAGGASVDVIVSP